MIKLQIRQAGAPSPFICVSTTCILDTVAYRGALKDQIYTCL